MRSFVLIVCFVLVEVVLGVSGLKEKVFVSDDSVEIHFPSQNYGKSLCPDKLSDAINSIFANCSFCDQSSWGVLVEEVLDNSGKKTNILYDLNGQKFMVPASNNKVLTTSTAWLSLGQNFGIQTQIIGSPSSDPSILSQACFIAKGDPSLTYPDFQNVAKQISNMGINKIQSFTLDSTYFTDMTPNLNWEWGDLAAYYGAQPTAVVVNEQVAVLTVTPTNKGQAPLLSFSTQPDTAYFMVKNNALTVDSNGANTLSIYYQPTSPYVWLYGNIPQGSEPFGINVAAIDPIDHALFMLTYALKESGIEVYNSSSGFCDTTNAVWKNLTTITSPSLASMLNWTLLVSDNLYAETFLRHLGKQREAQRGESNNLPTDVLGKLQVSEFLQSLGVDNNTFAQDDGSGLSRHNLVSPLSLLTTVRQVYYLPGNLGKQYISFLPVAGETGDLQNRFVGTPAQGVVHAKTGSMTGINSLSGIVLQNQSGYNVIVFSIIENDANVSGAMVRQVIDQIVVKLAEVKACLN
eukprot:TRINITY_DN3106_c0_g2_i1.p1 TRINITY_DN3106_c0_g2~~TRINITY_DN3106_c0_g2_i1.p1  ORF type:complete len:519 (+),score=108.20 TRINITY_DN3106_c0_g2_i1:141-1697(+)